VSSSLDPGEPDGVTYGGAPPARITLGPESSAIYPRAVQVWISGSKTYWHYPHAMHPEKDKPCS